MSLLLGIIAGGAQQAGGGGPGGGFPVVEDVLYHAPFGSAPTHNIAMPGTVNAGDKLVMFTVSSAVQVAPSGWTEAINFYDTVGSGLRSYVFTKTADGSEGGGVAVVSIPSNGDVAAETWRISGAAATDFFESATAFITNVSTKVPPSLSPSWGELETLWLSFAFAYYGDRTVVSYPFPENQHARLNTFRTLYSSSKEEQTSTVVPDNLVLSSSEYGGIFTIGVKPAGLPPPPVYATFDPGHKHASITLSDGDKATDGGDGGGFRSAYGQGPILIADLAASRSVEYEILAGSPMVGIADDNGSLSPNYGGGGAAGQYVVWAFNGAAMRPDWEGGGTWPTFGPGDRIGFKLTKPGGNWLVTAYKNGVETFTSTYFSNYPLAPIFSSYFDPASSVRIHTDPADQVYFDDYGAAEGWAV